MKNTRELLTSTLVAGLFVVVPGLPGGLLLLKGMKSAASLVRPLATLLPAWIPAEGLCSLLLVLMVCFLVGVAVRTRSGRVVRERMEGRFFETSGLRLLRSLTQRLAGNTKGNAWQPAMVESRTGWTCVRHRRVGTDDARCSCRRCRRHWLEPYTSSTGNACISSTFPSERPSGRSPAGAPALQSWWRPCVRRVIFGRRYRRRASSASGRDRRQSAAGVTEIITAAYAAEPQPAWRLSGA